MISPCIHTLLYRVYTCHPLCAIHRVYTRYYTMYIHVHPPTHHLHTRQPTVYTHVTIPCTYTSTHHVHTRKPTMYTHVTIPCIYTSTHHVHTRSYTVCILLCAYIWRTTLHISLSRIAPGYSPKWLRAFVFVWIF